MIIRYYKDSGEVSGIFPYATENIPQGHAIAEVELDENTARLVMEEPERFAEIVGQSSSELANDLDRLKALNRKKIDEGGRERLKQLGARNLEEASIAAIGMSDELNRYELSEGYRAELEVRLNVLQSIRRAWNNLIAANEAAQTHAELEEVRWP